VRKVDDEFYKKYMDAVNTSLKHPTPSVRKAAEEILISLYIEYGSRIEMR
jgi:hypothetical protein